MMGVVSGPDWWKDGRAFFQYCSMDTMGERGPRDAEIWLLCERKRILMHRWVVDLRQPEVVPVVDAALVVCYLVSMAVVGPTPMPHAYVLSFPSRH